MTALMPGLSDRSPARSAILLVEDHDVLREALSETLQVLGYIVYSAAGGEEALTLANQVEEISLVISGRVMPGMNALQLYEALGFRPGRDKMLILTGYPLLNSAESLLVRQGVRWARKPIRLDELERVVSEMLAG